VPPGNRLEALRGDREGQSSIRINNQWRYVLFGARAKPGTLKSSTIIEERRHEHQA